MVGTLAQYRHVAAPTNGAWQRREAQGANAQIRDAADRSGTWPGSAAVMSHPNAG